MNYSIEKLNELNRSVIKKIQEIWEASVRATHDFLTEEDILRIRPQVAAALSAVTVLVIKDNGNIIGFSGLSDQKIEMLFLSPTYRGQGIGQFFIKHILNEYTIKYVDVNEQNLQAINFYKRTGFTIAGRSATDEAGNPFPILHMKRSTMK